MGGYAPALYILLNSNKAINKRTFSGSSNSIGIGGDAISFDIAPAPRKESARFPGERHARFRPCFPGERRERFPGERRERARFTGAARGREQ